MSDTVDVAIIGAGPYGLSLAAYLSSVGVEFRIFGSPMDAWRSHMPPGMLLKSHPWASNLYDPSSSFTLKQFCAERHIDYHDSRMPLPVETFVAYGEQFQRRLVPSVERKLLSRLEYAGGNFRASFDDGSQTHAKRVVLAVGVHPFKRVPASLSHLPPELLSHSGDHGPLDAFAGKEVVILGSGASATDLAGLLYEKRAAVSLIARTRELRFAGAPRTKRSLPRRLAQPLREVVSPGSGIGRGWALKMYADAPTLFYALPAKLRRKIVQSTLGPLGHSAMKDRVLGRVPILLAYALESANREGDRVELKFRLEDGSIRVHGADHVIAATGYEVDLNRLAFLDSRLLSQIEAADGSPVLSRNYESSVPGLHFVGPATAFSFGPVSRFVCGAIHPARALARHMASSQGRQAEALVELPGPTVAAQ